MEHDSACFCRFCMQPVRLQAETHRFLTVRGWTFTQRELYNTFISNTSQKIQKGQTVKQSSSQISELSMSSVFNSNASISKQPFNVANLLAFFHATFTNNVNHEARWLLHTEKFGWHKNVNEGKQTKKLTYL